MLNTAEELATELTGDGLVVLNPVLSCGDTVNGTYSGTGGLGIDNGIILSTGNVDKIFVPYEWGYVPMGNGTTTCGIDEDMNNYLNSIGDSSVELYAACILEVDVVPKAPTLTLDYIYATGFGQWVGSYASGCEDFVDFITIFIKGGTEYTEYKNIATIPGTDIPVNANSIMSEGDESCAAVEGGPYTEYFVGTSVDMMSYFNYDGYTTVFSPSASVTPCDTYHVKIGVADIRVPFSTVQSLSSSLFLKAGSLRTTGQPVDCPDPEPSGLNDYFKQQSKIKVSPNPFVNGMAVTIENSSVNEQFEITLTEIQGRKLHHYTGSLNEVNIQLITSGSDLRPGMYILNVKSESGKYNHSMKVLKR